MHESPGATVRVTSQRLIIGFPAAAGLPEGTAARQNAPTP